MSVPILTCLHTLHTPDGVVYRVYQGATLLVETTYAHERDAWLEAHPNATPDPEKMHLYQRVSATGRRMYSLRQGETVYLESPHVDEIIRYLTKNND
jgi:hypothetical protein